jgi:hypothetical protein
MAPRLVYLDTSIWNILSRQAPDGEDAHRLSHELNLQFTLGLNAFFELLKSFYGNRPDAVDRGRRLFSCLRDYLESGISILRTWEELLVDEAMRASGRLMSIQLFSDSQWRRSVLDGAKLHSRGQLPAGLRGIIERRDAVSEKVRISAEQLIRNQPQLLEDLQRVSPSDIEALLNRESVGKAGQDLLRKYVPQVFKLVTKPMPLTNRQLAQILLSSASNRVAHAVVRSDMYQIWRAARARISSGAEGVSFRKCIPDDSYHVVNACYCDVFVTEDDDGQAVAAQYVVPGLKALVYRSRSRPIMDWLATELEV